MRATVIACCDCDSLLGARPYASGLFFYSNGIRMRRQLNPIRFRVRGRQTRLRRNIVATLLQKELRARADDDCAYRHGRCVGAPLSPKRVCTADIWSRRSRVKATGGDRVACYRLPSLSYPPRHLGTKSDKRLDAWLLGSANTLFDCARSAWRRPKSVRDSKRHRLVAFGGGRATRRRRALQHVRAAEWPQQRNCYPNEDCLLSESKCATSIAAL